MLIGKTIALRPATPDDAQLVADWVSDPAYLGDFFNISPHTRQMMEAELADAHGPEKGWYLITSRERQEPMGMIGFWNPFTLTAFFKGLELWWNLHPQHRHQGVATQAVCLLINHLFDSTPTERLQASIVPGNEPSCRVAERAGMQRGGIYRKVFFLHGHYVDLYLYAIVREDWKNQQAYRVLTHRPGVTTARGEAHWKGSRCRQALVWGARSPTYTIGAGLSERSLPPIS